MVELKEISIVLNNIVNNHNHLIKDQVSESHHDSVGVEVIEVRMLECLSGGDSLRRV